MIWWPYFISWSKRSLSRCRSMDHILCKWRLLRQYFEWVGVFFGWVGHYFGWVEVSGSVWGIILGGWGWVGALFDNARFRGHLESPFYGLRWSYILRKEYMPFYFFIKALFYASLGSLCASEFCFLNLIKFLLQAFPNLHNFKICIWQSGQL